MKRKVGRPKGSKSMVRTLRDDFALVALPALIQAVTRNATGGGSENIARHAYTIADAMLAAREGK